MLLWCRKKRKKLQLHNLCLSWNKMLMWWRTISTWESTWTAEEKISTDLRSQGSWDAAICDATSWIFSSRRCDEHSGLYFVLLGELTTPKEWVNWSGRLAQWLAILSYTYRTAAPSRDRYRKYFMPPQDIWMVVRYLPENKLLLFISSVKKDSVFIVLFMEWF